MAGAFIEVNQQAVPLRIPFGVGLEIDCDVRLYGAGEWKNRSTVSWNRYNVVVKFLTDSAARVMNRCRATVLRRLIDVIEASQMYAPDMQSCDVQHSVLEGLNFDTEASLHAVRRFVISGEARDDRITEKSAGGDEATWAARRRQRFRV